MSDHNQPTTSDIEDSSPSIDSELPATKKYSANPNRKKREAKINPEYEAAIIKLLFMYRRDGLNTKSAVIEHIFENKSFTRNECDSKISNIKSHLSGYKGQCQNIYEYFIDLALEKKVQSSRDELKEFVANHKTESQKKVSKLFYDQLSDLSVNIDRVLGLKSFSIEDDSPEIQSIKELFNNGDIKANLPRHRNISYRLDTDTDYKYFGKLEGVQNSGKNRRALEQVLINNTNFILEITNRNNLKFVNGLMFDLNEEIALFNTSKMKGVTTGLIKLYDMLTSFNNKLIAYEKEVSNDSQ